MTNLKFITILFSILFLFSCKKENTNPEQQEPTQKSVYVAGAIKDDANNTFIAVYWKDSIYENFGSLGITSLALDIAVTDNKTIYACGYENSGAGNKAVYWKQLPTDNYPTTYSLPASGVSVAYNLLLHGNDVYVCGYETINGKQVAKYWKNGVSHVLTDSTNSAAALCLAINDEGKLLIGGYEQNGSNRIGKIWSDSYPTKTIIAGVGHSDINSLSIPSHDVYAACTYQSPLFVVSYFKNDVRNDITDGSFSANVNKIEVVPNDANNDVYLAGVQRENTNTTATYWKNGLAKNITDGTNMAAAYDLFVDGTDVYVAYQEYTGAVGSGGTPVSFAKYIKNDVSVTLPILDNKISIVRAICIK